MFTNLESRLEHGVVMANTINADFGYHMPISECVQSEIVGVVPNLVTWLKISWCCPGFLIPKLG